MGCVSTLVVLGTGFSGSDSPSRIDVLVASALRPAATTHGAATWLIIQLGDPPVALALTVLLALVAFSVGRPAVGILAFAGMSVTAAAVFTLKPVVGRTLDGALTFPSGHTAAATVVAVVGVILVAANGSSRAASLVALLGGILLVLAMGTALVVQDEHYVTDVVGGVCAGSASVLAVASVIDMFQRPHGRRRGHRWGSHRRAIVPPSSSRPVTVSPTVRTDPDRLRPRTRHGRSTSAETGDANRND